MGTTERLEHGELENLSPEETKALMDRGEAVLIDVRTPAEYFMEHIRGGLLTPLSDFHPSFLPSPEGKRIVLMCGSGIRSKAAADAMLEFGFTSVAHIEGGIKAWKAAGLPFIAVDPVTGASQEVVRG